MKTLLFTLEYPPFRGGVANYYGNLVSYWKSYLQLKHPKQNIIRSEALDDNISVLDNNKGELISNYLPFFRWLPAIRELNDRIKRHKIEYVLVGHVLPLGTVAFLLKKYYHFRGKEINYSVFFHGMDLSFAFRYWLKRQIAKQVIKSADSLICTNYYVANLLRNVLSNNYWHKIQVVNPGVDNLVVMLEDSTINKIKQEYRLVNKLVMFSLGRLVKRKGFDMVIEALPQANKTVPNLVYVIAGAGPDELYLKNLAKEKKVENVIFLGEISERDKWVWFDICDFFIMTSRDINGDFEGFGIVYLEANLLGKPVIAGSSGGVNDAVVNGYNGITVNSEDSHSIAKGIIRFAENNEWRKKLGLQGKERVRNEFNWEKQIDKIYKIIERKSL